MALRAGRPRPGRDLGSPSDAINYYESADPGKQNTKDDEQELSVAFASASRVTTGFHSESSQGTAGVGALVEGSYRTHYSDRTLATEAALGTIMAPGQPLQEPSLISLLLQAYITISFSIDFKYIGAIMEERIPQEFKIPEYTATQIAERRDSTHLRRTILPDYARGILLPSEYTSQQLIKIASWMVCERMSDSMIFDLEKHSERRLNHDSICWLRRYIGYIGAAFYINKHEEVQDAIIEEYCNATSSTRPSADAIASRVCGVAYVPWTAVPSVLIAAVSKNKLGHQVDAFQELNRWLNQSHTNWKACFIAINRGENLAGLPAPVTLM